MSKLKITGNSNPIVGELENYSIDDFFQKLNLHQNTTSENHSSNVFDNQIKWSIWILDKGSWRKTKENDKTGATVNYTFHQKSLTRKGIKMLVEANGEKDILDITPKPADQAKIIKVDLLDADFSKPTRPFAYGDSVIARVHCVDMERFPLLVTLWEDDSPGAGHNKANTFIKSQKGTVLNGKADVEFYLDPSISWLANARLAPGDKNEGANHEYYVTAEVFEKIPIKRVASSNTNVPNPDYKPEITKPKPPSPASQKEPSKKDKKEINKSEQKVHDYHEQKVTVQNKIVFNPMNPINSLMKVNMDPNWWKSESQNKKSICPNCDKDITLLEFNTMFPNSKHLFQKGTNSLSSKTPQEFIDSLNKTLKEFKINTCIRKAFFLAQIARETGEFSRIDENLNYTSESALHAFWQSNTHPLLYSHANIFLNNPEKLGNYVYRNIAENGNETSGDGYKFRGRGLLQITRKKGYRRFGEFSGKNLTSNPDLLLDDLDLMVRSAGWYWRHGVLLNDGSEKDINNVADLEDFINTTKLVHGSTSDVVEREKILNRIKVTLKTNECKKRIAEILSNSDIEYHIFYSGIIRYKIHNEKRENASYYYHDDQGTIHSIGRYNLKKIANTYGEDFKDRLENPNIYLFDIRNLKNYMNGNTKFNLTMNPGTNRFFMNDITVASLLGAMLDCNYEDFVYNGFSDELGASTGGSKSHKNGMNGDFRYLRKDKSGKNVHLNQESEKGDPCGWKGMDEKMQNIFNDALYKYGWKSMLSWKYNGKTLNHSKHYADHYHHLHVQTFTPTLKKIK